MFWLLLWILISWIFIFLVILDDKRPEKTPKWLEYTSMVVFFWLFVPLKLLDLFYKRYGK